MPFPKFGYIFQKRLNIFNWNSFKIWIPRNPSAFEVFWKLQLKKMKIRNKNILKSSLQNKGGNKIEINIEKLEMIISYIKYHHFIFFSVCELFELVLALPIFKFSYRLQFLMEVSY